jgi:cytochrome P450
MREEAVGNEPVVVTRYAEIRDAMYNRDLSRSLDDRSFEEGNPRAGVLSTLHGAEHKERRRLENPLFRRAELFEYENELFPIAIDRIAERDAVGDLDLLDLAGSMAVVLATRRAGIDHDGSREQLSELFWHGLSLAQGASVADAVIDQDRVRRETERTLDELEERYVGPSRRRREVLLDAVERGEESEDALPHDLITVALKARRNGDVELDDALLTREAGLYLHGGSHTSAQTTCNAFEFLLGYDGVDRSGLLREAGSSLLVAQQIVHETLRLVPMTPEIKRRVVTETVVAGTPMRPGETVVLDIRTGNRDPDYYGADAEVFDPQRTVAEGASLWGLSFGAGAHICIGRSVAGGLPLQGGEDEAETSASHLFGQVARMVRVIAARGVQRHPEREPQRDGRTTRASRWASFPVRFPRAE